MNDELQLKTAAQHALDTATSLKVLSQTDYERAGETRKDIKAMLSSIKNYWGPKKDQAHQLHKALVQAEKDMTSPLEQADKMIDQRMGEYRREIERQRMEAEKERRRIEEEARRAAEEAQRLIDEASQKEELDEDDAEILMIAREEVETKIAAYESIKEAPAEVKMQGISVRRTWKARVVDPGLVPISVAGIMIRPIDESVLNKIAVNSKGAFECPGVEFYQEESTQVRL